MHLDRQKRDNKIMNDIISWLATNNTGMIRFGLTAVIVLIGVYLFRTFFVTSGVAESAKEQTAPDEKAAGKNTEPASVNTDAAQVKDETEKNLLQQEIKKYQDEVGDLKKQLASLETLKTENQNQLSQLDELKRKLEQVQSHPSEQTTSGSDASVSDLQKKIEELQARLAEYEIIAEDISEIGQLRQDNEELRRRLAGVTSDVVAESEPKPESSEPASETVSEESYINNSDQLLDEMLAEHESSKAAQNGSQSSSYADIPDVPQMKSEKPVTATEQQMLNQFEESLAKKVSS